MLKLPCGPDSSRTRMYKCKVHFRKQCWVSHSAIDIHLVGKLVAQTWIHGSVHHDRPWCHHVCWYPKVWGSMMELPACWHDFLRRTMTRTWWQCPERCWAKSIGILVFPSPTRYMLTPLVRRFFTNLRCSSWIALKWAVILLQSWTWTGHFSKSTGSSVTNKRSIGSPRSSRGRPQDINSI